MDDEVNEQIDEIIRDAETRCERNLKQQKRRGEDVFDEDFASLSSLPDGVPEAESAQEVD